MADLIKLKVFPFRHEAEMMKGFLEKEGIKSVIIADDLGGYRPDVALARGGVGLFVNKDDGPRAKEALKFFEGKDEVSK